MIKVTEMYRTNIACPARWEGLSAEGGAIILTYRRGQLTVSHKGRTIFDQQVNANLHDGYMTPWETFEHVKHLFAWDSAIDPSAEGFLDNAANGRIWWRDGFFAMKKESEAQGDFFSDCVEMDFFTDAEAQEFEFDFGTQEGKQYEFDFS